MKMPGFNAELSLYRAKISYGTDLSIGKIREAVYPAGHDGHCNYDCVNSCLNNSCFITECNDLPSGLDCEAFLRNCERRCYINCGCHLLAREKGSTGGRRK